MRIPARNLAPKASRPNLVPLADAFFLIFFLYALDQMAQPQRVSIDEPPGLWLPSVASSLPDEVADPCRLIIYITREGALFVGGEPRRDKWIHDALSIEARLSRNPDTGTSDRTVMIWADERVAFRHVRKILDWCREDEIRIWDLEFGVRAVEHGLWETSPRKHAQETRPWHGAAAR